ncbi:MAG: replication factor C large subunit, partial [Actinomycetia bacterium]|nr:replication factor C large subunit [Actinomycetes bacterium]
MFKSWADKYQPSKLKEVVGQSQALRAMLDWAESWENGKPKSPALLLYGAAGTGKTIAAGALAQ